MKRTDAESRTDDARGKAGKPVLSYAPKRRSKRRLGNGPIVVAAMVALFLLACWGFWQMGAFLFLRW
ncbi:MAG TPA: hypothetical protein VEA69_25305 [Tepidisphaeraceae bacterium]|nr:hypothetical protein [Tepidisphaeraceae bacterium]